MSESVKNLLHQQVTSIAFKPPDIQAITRAGGRRLRRRRIVALLATVAAVALAGSAAAVVVGGGTEHRPPPIPASPWRTDAVSWAFGTTIYVGTDAGIEEIEVGHEVRAYVRSATGFVVLDGTDAVYSITEDGVTPIGQVNDTLPDNTDVQRLVVNSSGTLVGWVDEAASPESLTVRIYDTVYGSTRDFPGPLTTPDVHELPGVLLFAIDDRTAYWRTYEGVHQVDLDTRSDRLIVAREDVSPGDAIYSFEVYSAEHGVLAFSPDDDRTMFAGPSVKDAIELHNFREVTPEAPEPQAGEPEIISGHTDPVRLSPTGTWLSFGTFNALATPVGDPKDGGAEFSDMRLMPAVLDAATGERVNLAIPGHPALALPSVWLDDNTLQVVWFETAPSQVGGVPTRVVFYECSIPDGMCQVGAELGPPFDESFMPVLPDGRWYGTP
jgi:hypothetical protein